MLVIMGTESENSRSHHSFTGTVIQVRWLVKTAACTCQFFSYIYMHTIVI
jgi:hypothetical protein